MVEKSLIGIQATATNIEKNVLLVGCSMLGLHVRIISNYPLRAPIRKDLNKLR